MTDAVVTIRAIQTVSDAIEVLAESGVRHLPVLGDAGQLVGMLSDRDIRSLGLTNAIDKETLAQLQSRMNAPVSRMMSSDVMKVGPATELPEVIDLMLEAGVGAVPVVDDDEDTLLGIVSYVDVLRALRDIAGEA
jgi:acetoin utilization protein AcuB